MLDDTQVRLAAFKFLEEQQRLAGNDGALPYKVLLAGFVYEGQRIPLMGPKGIFKPRVLPEMPLSITTVAVEEGETRPYDDTVGEDGLLRYRYRGTDPQHPDNVGLRLARQRRVPLIYFFGIVKGWYVAEWPVYIVGDDPERLAFTVSVDDRRFASLGSIDAPDVGETEIRRRYATRIFQQRLHQRQFRERVVRAYQHHCAVCRLRRDELLDAAHIVPDADPRGVPSVTNGLALCTLHHAAFDRNVIGITPDCVVHVRRDVLEQEDGPMLIHGLQGFHGRQLRLPAREAWRPDRGLLEERYHRFQQLAG
ncbi:MAG TPA: HNH endonuclease [Vicinamibacterales bacterium]